MSAPTPSETVTPVKTLILDAGPLLSLTPLRNLATTYLTTPAVLAELRDVNAREHWERLKLLQGIEVQVREPDAVSMAKGTFPLPADR
jgi:RNA-binding protein NOB1